jgi:hypothetical protein
VLEDHLFECFGAKLAMEVHGSSIGGPADHPPDARFLELDVEGDELDEFEAGGDGLVAADGSET